MYLKALEIQNFKSFSEKQKIPFNSNFIVITGPNGSGKSNILDAVRWVLGEQRIKLLRAEKSEEVIFGGNKFLSPSKYTQISIVFSIPYGENFYQEVVISRRLERDGESEYFLNDKPLRLKDLQLFLSNYGLGRHNFVFIGQGELESFVLNRDDLKKYIEDVAGIAGYQEKVKETQLKLEILEAKWRELEDRRLTILENLNVLRKEAENAERYLSLSEELENIKESLNFYHWQRIKKSFEDYNKEISIKEKKLEELKNNFSFINDELSKVEDRIRNMEKEIEENKKVYERIKSALMEVKIKFEIVSQKIININDERQRIQKEIKEIEKELKDIEMELKILKNDNFQEEISNWEKEIRTKEKELREKEILKIKYEQKLSSFSEYSLLSEEALKNELRLFEDTVNKINKTLESLKRKKDLLRNYLERVFKETREKELLIKSKERYLEEITFEFQRERRILKDLEESQLDIYPKGVREILALKDNEVFGVIADVIQVEKEYLNAIYNVLGNSLFDVIVKDEYSAKRLIDYLKTRNLGWATFRPLNFYHKEIGELNIPEGIWALNVIKFSSQYEGLIYNILGNVLIFEDFESALKRRNLLKKGWRLVTIKGEVFSGNGAISGGTRLNLQDMLHINKLKLEKEERVKQLNQSINFLEGDLVALRSSLKELTKKKEKISILLRKIEEKVEKNQNFLKEYNQKIEKITSFLKEGEESIKVLDELEKEISVLEEELKIKKKKFEEIMGEYVFINKKRSFLQERKEILEKKLKEFYVLEENLKKDLKNLEEDKISLEKKRTQEEEEEERYKKNINDKEKDIKSIKEKAEDLRKKWQELREEIIVEETVLKQLIKRKNELEREYFEKFEKEPCLKINLPENKLKIREKEILKEIEDLGPINFLAKEKLSIEEKKYKELSEELEDIQGSIFSLRKIIKDTRKEAERKFLDTYEKLRYISNKNWKLFFPFGEFDLSLSNLDNPLDSEVSIKLTSDRKNFKSLLMLSGGEKSISALSLLLAGLEIAPVNFCFWDEVDSALDNHNAEILGKKIKDLSEKIQFIIISHNPALIEFSEVLYGVTMNEKGSSQIIAYKLEKEVSLK
ncbi:MAG: chromosome segregation protein SMC [Dictyoglomus sp.]|nr:chromosome segregation protein SMC [Dictyoglomus sp.]MCX7942406.1 chromosome segregation protein SMC [Dictyoglomaceae bacterium]MDW8188933.1 chromosome segregation SMC family protein [Dictyoglomus sp.]